MSTRAVMCKVTTRALPEVEVPRSESQLVSAAKRRDRHAFDTLVEGHVEALFWAAFRITKQREDAEVRVESLSEVVVPVKSVREQEGHDSLRVKVIELELSVRDHFRGGRRACRDEANRMFTVVD